MNTTKFSTFVRLSARRRCLTARPGLIAGFDILPPRECWR